MKAKPPEGSQGISVARNALKPFANLTELEYLAKPLLTDAAYGYYASGAEGEHTLRDNEAAFARWRLLPRVLVDMSRVDTSCTILGRKLASPILVAPMAMQKLAHPDGELAVARACVASGTAYILSTMSTAGIDEVAAAAADQQEQQQAAATVTAMPSKDPAAAKPVLWFQLYVMKQREVTEAMIRQAEELGYDALMVTVDAPRLGKRDRDERNKFSLPPGLVLKNIEVLTRGAGHTQHEESDEGSAFGRHFSNLFDRDLTWDFISWLKGRTKLPVVIKGILSPDDARHAVQLGVDAIIVSNHGGRQLDHSPAAVDVLPHIARAVQGRIPILVDGGIRRGTDVVKCLALGASAVCLGRPVLWALALGGQQGVQSALELLKYEVELAMALLGCRSINEVTNDFIVPPRGGELQLPQSRL